MNFKKIAAAALFLASSAVSATSEDVITLKFADQYPATHAGSRFVGQAFEALVEERSNGRVQIEYYPAQQLAKAKGMLDAVKNRVSDIAVVGIVYVPEQLPLSTIVGLPGLVGDLKTGLAAFDQLAANELAGEFAKQGVRPLFMVATPPYQMQFADLTEVSDVSDFEGLKIRVSGPTGELVAGALGGVGVRVSGPDTFVAVERGTVDATMLSMPSVLAYKLEEVTASTTRNAGLGSVAFSVMINEDVYDGLPADVQELLNSVAQDVSASFAVNWMKEVNEGYGIAQAAGVNIIDLSPKVLDQMNARLVTVQQQWVDQMEARGLPGAATLEAFKAYLAAAE